jgi:PAS domain S-box-containing protein
LVIQAFRYERERLQQDQRLKTTAESLQRRAIQLQVAAEIARDATASLELDRVLNRTVQLVRSRFGFYHAGIFLLDEQGEYAILHAAAGDQSASEMLERGHRLKVGQEGIVGYVTSSGKPRLVLDVRDDKIHYLNPALPETRSEMALPFKVGERIIGAMDVQSRHEDAFDDHDVIILQTLADLLAIAIDKARLHEQVQRHADELEHRVQERTYELERERAQLQATLDSMGEGVIYDEKLQTRYINRALTVLTGYQSSEWHGYLDPLKPADTSHTEFAGLMRTIYETVDRIGIWRGEFRFRRKDGLEFDAGLTCTKVADEDGHIVGAVTIIRDVSQEKALQAQKSRFVANASHELRTPITNLKTRLYLLHKQPEKLDEHLQVVENVVERMRRLVEELLDISRFERGLISLQPQRVLLQVLIANVIATQLPEAERKHITLTAKLPRDPLYIYADPDRIEQVITNTVTNAINYTADGGTVTVVVTPTNGQAVIEVFDTGIGIAPENIDQVFQPFFRVGESSVTGTGLGLSIAKEIIEMHGGEIGVESEFGKGSRFYIKLALDQQQVGVSSSH